MDHFRAFTAEPRLFSGPCIASAACMVHMPQELLMSKIQALLYTMGLLMLNKKTMFLHGVDIVRAWRLHAHLR